jgi:hypothetical protein
VANRRTLPVLLPVLLFVLGGALLGPAHGADKEAPERVVDLSKIKARELEKQRLIAKLHSEVPKMQETPSGANPLSAPIFHRYDRP